jgi:DNA-binding transcriptional LysR family regulator
MIGSSDLDIFARVARTGNMSAAGREMGLSPAVVSKRISALESRLGARLFRRTTRTLTLTEVGHGFFRRVVDIMSLTEEALDYVGGSTRSPRGMLRVACCEAIHRAFLLKRLAAFAGRFPQIELDIDLCDNDVDVIGSGYDAAITIGIEATTASGAIHRLAPLPFIICASAGYIERHGAPADLDDLARHNCITGEYETAWPLYKGRSPVAVAVAGRLRSPSRELVRGALNEGLGIAFLPAIAIEDELRSGHVKRVLPDYHGNPDLAVLAVHPGMEYLPARLKAFVDFLVEGQAEVRPAAIAA